VTTLDGAVDLARDRELVERCQRGEETAFAELYDRYHRRLLRFCLRRLHSYDDAEEAVQEAFTRAWRALPNFGGDRRFYPWLTVIAGNACTDILRRRARVVPMNEMPVYSVELDAEDVDSQLLRQVDLAMATEAFTHLSDRHQRVLKLRESTEWSAQRIAESEGVAVPAVDTLLWRARQAFKREFAVLSDASGLAGLVGVGIASLRRTIGRAWMRVASYAPAPMRGPGAIAATVAITGAAIAGGSVALVGSGPSLRSVTRASSPSASVSSSRSGGPAGTGSSAGGTAAGNTASGGGGHGTSRSTGGSQGPAGPLTAATGKSGISGVTGGTATATPPSSGVATTTLNLLYGPVGGLGGLGGPGSGGLGSTGSSGTAGGALGTAGGALGTAGGSLGTAGGTVSGTVGTVGGVLGTVGGTASGSGTGTTSGTGTSTGTSGTGTGTTGTAVRTVATSTSLPLTPSNLTGGTSTSSGSGSGSLLGGL
jgi:RNA polymerase sigma factor (sigma-70 family)